MLAKKHHGVNGNGAYHWNSTDDFYLLEGVDKYGLEEWEKIVQDINLWDHSDPKTLDPDQAWQVLYRKIEGCEPDLSQEAECIE